MEMQRVSIIDLMTAYITANSTDNEKMKSLSDDFKKITGKRLEDMNGNQRMLEYFGKMADHLIKEWNKVRKKNKEFVITLEDNKMNEFLKNNPLLLRFCNRMKEVHVNIETTCDEHTSYIG